MKRAVIIALIVVGAIILFAALRNASQPHSFLDRYMQCVDNASTYAAYEACGSPDRYGTP